VRTTAKVIDAVISLRDNFTAKMNDATKSMELSVNQAKRTGKQIETTGKSLSKFGGTLTKSVTVPIIAAGAGLIKIAEDFRTAENKIRTSTGATGNTLKSLDNTMTSVFKSTVSSLSDTSDAVSSVYKTLDVTGKPLQTLSTQFLNLSRITGTDLTTNLQLAGQAFHAMNLNSGQYSGALDTVFKISQQTGVGFDTLLGSIQKFAPTLKAAGMDFNESAALIGGMSKAGVNVQKVMMGLTTGIAKLAKGGTVDAGKALGDLFDKIKNAKTPTLATADAVGTFGARAGLALTTAIREGKLSYTDLLSMVNKSKDTINKATEQTLTPIQRLVKLGHSMSIALRPVGDSLVKALEGMAPAAERLAGTIKNMADGFNKLSPHQKETIFKFLALAAAIGPLLVVAGVLTANVGHLVKGFGGMAGGIKKAGGIMEWIKSPANLVAIAIIAIIAAIVLIIWYWPQISKFFNNLKGIFDRNRTAITLIAAALTILFLPALIGLAIQAAIATGRLILQTGATLAYNIAVGAATAAQWLWDAAMSANPIGAIIALVVLFVAGLVLLYNNSDKVRTAMDNLWHGIKTGAADAINWVIDRLNALINLIDKIPGVSIPTISHMTVAPVPPKKLTAAENLGIKKYAAGTMFSSGGLSLVGEKGPELVNLPRGSQVIPNDKTTGLGNSQDYINKNIIKPFIDMTKETPIWGNTMMVNFMAGRDKAGINMIAWLNTHVCTPFISVVTSSTSWGRSLIGNVIAGMQSRESDLTKEVTTLTDKVIKQFNTSFGIASPSKVTFGIGQYLTQGLINGMSSLNVQKFAKKQMAGLSSAMGGTSSKFVPEWLTSALKFTNTPLSWLSGLMKLVNAESGGNPSAVNKTAVGGEHATGLLQTLPSTFAHYAMKGLGGITNPVANAAAAINYIKSRYGSIYNTPLFKGGGYVGYAAGTNYAAGGLSLVGEQGPELLSLPRGSQVTNHNETTKALNKGGNIYKIYVTGNSIREEADIDKLSTAIVRKIKMAELNMA